MTSLKLAFILFFFILLSSDTKGFINTVTVFKRFNKTLKRHNYIITCGDVHESLPHLNNSQIRATKSLVYNSDPNWTLFLVEDIASMKIPHPLLANVVNAINTTYDNSNTKNRIPIVTLVNYALSHKKNAINLDDRAQTLIQTIFYYLVISYIQRTKYSSRSNYTLSDYKISLPELGFVLMKFLKEFEQYYVELSNKLKLLEESVKNKETLDSREVKDLKYFIEFYHLFSNDLENDKEYAASLIAKNFDLISYLVNEYKGYKNIKALNLELPRDGYNFSLYTGATFLSKMLTLGSYTVELKALKLIIDNLNSKSKVFIFAGQKHIENLNQILEKMAFKKIYQKTETPNISRLYGHITEHIEQAQSYNKINNKYILNIKRNLRAIDPTFFKICEKKHLHAKDFKDLR